MKGQYTRKNTAKGFVRHLKGKNMYRDITIKKTKLQRVNGKPLGYTVYYYLNRKK